MVAVAVVCNFIGKIGGGRHVRPSVILTQTPTRSIRSLPVEFEFVLEPQNIPRSCGDLLVCQKCFQTDSIEFA